MVGAVDVSVNISVEAESIVEKWNIAYGKLFKGSPVFIDFEEMTEKEIISVLKRTVREMDDYEKRYSKVKRNPIKLPLFLMEKLLIPEITELYELCKYKGLLLREIERIRKE